LVAPIILAVTLMYAGRRDDAARQLAAAERAMVGRDDEDSERSYLRSNWVSLGLFGEDEDEEVYQARLAMSLAEGTGNPSNLAMASYALGWALRHRHPDESIAAFDRHLAMARRASNTGVLPAALAYGAQVAASQGDADGAKARLTEALDLSVRDESWVFITVSLDAAVGIFCYLGDARAAAVLAGAVETTLASLRFPYLACRGPGLAVRTANLARAREALGDACYEQAWAEGVAMNRQEALAFLLQHL
jgi:hypothetical protein